MSSHSLGNKPLTRHSLGSPWQVQTTSSQTQTHSFSLLHSLLPFLFLYLFSIELAFLWIPSKRKEKPRVLMAHLVLSYFNSLGLTAFRKRIFYKVYSSLPDLCVFILVLATKPHELSLVPSFPVYGLFSPPSGTTHRRIKQDSGISGSCYKIF